MAFIQINKKAYFNNLDIITSKVDINKIILVLKDNAYGHGIDIISKLAYQYGIKNIAVKNTKEAQSIKYKFNKILILSEKNNFIKKNNYEYVINCYSTIDKLPKYCKIHLKVNTGMNRNGIDIFDLEKSIILIKDKELDIVGIMSHFYNADIDDGSIELQLKLFKNIKQNAMKFISNLGINTIPSFHIHNSSALFRGIDVEQYDFVRVGLASYGYVYLPNIKKEETLKPVLSLYAEKISQRELTIGDIVGYGAIYKSQKKQYVSTYDLGYSDGLFRNDIDKDILLTDNYKVLGRISMDSIVINSTKENICIFNNALTISKQFNTIVYDVLVKLNRELKRILV
jgi:alanine racemase